MLFQSAKEFIDYMRALPGASREKEIDRVDNNGPYGPGNLRWTTDAEQSRNQRDTKYIMYRGVRYVFGDFVRNCTNISFTKANKLLREGKTPEEIASYIPKDVGRRAQGVRLGKLRPSAELCNKSDTSDDSSQL
jgi:hypothetical protein